MIWCTSMYPTGPPAHTHASQPSMRACVQQWVIPVGVGTNLQSPCAHLGGNDTGVVVNGPALDKQALRQARDLAVKAGHQVVNRLHRHRTSRNTVRVWLQKRRAEQCLWGGLVSSVQEVLVLKMDRTTRGSQSMRSCGLCALRCCTRDVCFCSPLAGLVERCRMHGVLTSMNVTSVPSAV